MYVIMCVCLRTYCVCALADMVLYSGYCVLYITVYHQTVSCSGYCVQYITMYHQTWSCIQGIVCSTSLCIIRLSLVFRVLCAVHHCVSSDFVFYSGHCVQYITVYHQTWSCVLYITLYVFVRFGLVFRVLSAVHQCVCIYQTWSCVHGIVCSTSLCMYLSD